MRDDDYSGFVPAFAPETVVTPGGTQTLTYDANGNMLAGYDGKVMTYDGENRPLSVTKGGVTTSYTYGADGSRLKTTVGGQTTLTFGPVEIRNFDATTGNTGDGEGSSRKASNGRLQARTRGAPPIRT
ncbi:MAG: hypothetical protein QNJ20_19000 [Paracoccaceae bacterium]|nr:hypothetical protein [Paracoccaceae bacterium]